MYASASPQIQSGVADRGNVDRPIAQHIEPPGPGKLGQSKREVNLLRRSGVSSSLALFKTDEIVVSLQWYGRDTSQVGISQRLGALVVILSGSGLQTVVKGKPDERLWPGSVLWLLAEANTFITNESGEPWSYLSLSFEGTEPLNPQWKPRSFVSSQSPD
jgi:hypothetical protein